MFLEDLESAEDLYQKRITRILTTEFPQYFAIVTRVRQEASSIGPEGGMISSTVVPQVQAIFPEGSLTKNIKVGLQVTLANNVKFAFVPALSGCRLKLNCCYTLLLINYQLTGN